MFSHLARISPRRPLSLTSRPLLTKVYSRTARPDEAYGPNAALLKFMREAREKELEPPPTERNYYKLKAWTMAIESVGELLEPITSVEQARSLRGIGPRIAKRIERFLLGDSPEAIAAAEARENAIIALREATGVGPKKAKQLVEAGCTSPALLHRRAYQSLLNSTQKATFRYHKLLQQPTSRTEAEQVLNAIRAGISPDFEAELVGDYRRGLDSLSSVDIMLHHSSHVHIPVPSAPKPVEGTWQRGRGVHSPAFRDKTRPGQLALRSALLTQQIIEPLRTRCLIVADTLPGITRWECIVRVPTNGETRFPRPSSSAKYAPVTSRHTRLNITLVPAKCRGSALLALTGDESFYLDIRRRAQKLGLHLNEYGLWRWESNGSPIDETGGHWKLEHVETEQDILQSVGLAWVDPTRRNFDYLQLQSNAKPTATRPRGRPWHEVS